VQNTGDSMIKIKIGNKWVGEGQPCFIIAEAGVNHNGDIEIAKKLIDAAKDAGADAVKFQTFKTENVVTKHTQMAEYQKKNTEKEESQFEMIKKFELDYKDFEALREYCDKRGITFLSTPHSSDAIDFLEPLVPVYKVGSGDLTNIPFLRELAKKRKPIILSTGMATLDEIDEAVKTVRKSGDNKIILLQCVTSYPARTEDVNLRVIQTLKQAFKLPAGLSDHTLSTIIPAVATAMGACVIEKHFTLDKNLPGPDHKASLEPEELKEMIRNIRDVEKAMGDGIKRPTAEEEEIKKIVRKSIVAKVDIPKRSTITRDMLEIKRPGTGIPPKYVEEVIGAKAKIGIHKEEVIEWNKIEIKGEKK